MDKFAERAAGWDSPDKVKMTRKFIDALKQRINLSPDWKALEIGAGTGLVGVELLGALRSVVFEDVSEAMLGVLATKVMGNPAAEILCAPVFDYKLPDLDLVFSCMAFHHLLEIDRVLSHLYQVCKPGARLVVGDLMTEDGSFHHFEDIPHRGFSMEWITEACSRAGFRVDSFEIYHVLKKPTPDGRAGLYDQFMLVATRL